MATHLTGGTDLLTYYDLVSCYKKYINQTIDPTLSSFVADLPGKTTVEADGYMLHLLRDPHIEQDSGNSIQPLDSITLKDAYQLKEGPVPGFDASLLGTDDGSGQDRAMEKQGSGSDSERKHRKKKKKHKHSHDHHDEEGSHGDHKKKRKRRKERDHSSRKDENEGASVIVD